jgi:leucyl/phenylalanyl-tRNA---protein transferase
LRTWDCPWIDCQQQTGHLASMGAGPLPRAEFLRGIAALTRRPTPPWQSVAHKDLLPQTLAAIVKS